MDNKVNNQSKENLEHPFRYAMSYVWGLRKTAESENAQTVGQSMIWVPLSALLLGILLASVAWLLSDFQAEVSAALVLILWIKLNGATTLDSLAQLADAALNRDRSVLQRLKSADASISGNLGTMVLVLSLLLKWSLLVQVIRSEWWTVIVLMPLVGWVFGQMVMLGARWVNTTALPDGWRDQVELSWLWPQWLLLLTALALASGWTLTLLVLGTWAWIVWWRKHLGGISLTIVLGWIELSELLWLMGLVLVLTP